MLALGVSSAKRSSVLPNVPTVAESALAGLAGFDYSLWVGLFAPAGTPADIVDKINREFQRLLRDPEVKERMTTLGAEAMLMSLAEFDRFMRTGTEDAARVVNAGG